ncbi:hypothetical protein T12_3071 [Trichinella patagoniensis]|uniref:Uncharacterized protein n=1 Tax=Trichinella patagoniensis TaxID=990121 RepID=A0A0V1A9I0_9BILA|nr:hypothetical protein T12_3071 [Trichinella patagoniensis]
MDLAVCQRFHYVQRQLSVGNPYKQEIISWLEYTFVSTALGTMLSMLILVVTGSIFHQQNRLLLDHSRLNGMNSRRSTCVITVSNLVTWVSGKMKLQDVNENMLRKFTPLHKFKKDLFEENPYKQETTSWREYTFVSTALDTLPCMLILGVTESFAIDASGLDRMNTSRSTCVIIKSNLVTCCLGRSARSQKTADSTTVISY